MGGPAIQVRFARAYGLALLATANPADDPRYSSERIFPDGPHLSRCARIVIPRPAAATAAGFEEES